jgi:hypothetical protein
MKNLGKSIFVSKNWPNDPICKSFSRLTNFMERDFNFKHKLEEFVKTFKRDDVVEMWILNYFPPKLCI